MFLSKARQHLEQVRAQAHELIEVARKDAESIKNSAREEGKRAAQSDLESIAKKQAATIAEEKINATFQSLENLSDQLEQICEKWLRQWQHETIPLAIVIAERLVRRQIDLDPTILLQWLTDAVALARGEQSLQIYIHPADKALLGPRLDSFIAKLGQKQKISVIDDESLQSPGVVVRSDDLEIDSQLISQLDRLIEEMR